MAKKASDPQRSPFFLYLSLLLVLVGVLIFFIGQQYNNKLPPVPAKTTVQPSVERAMVEMNTQAFINPQEPSKPLENREESVRGQLEKSKEHQLFFVTAVDDGRFNLKGSVRNVSFTGQQELTATIDTLLQGPGFNDQKKGYYSMIPEGSKLLSASIKNGVAYLNFNEEFRFNPFGRDGYEAQINQIVYTATEFPSVKQVKFLIDGQEIDYLSEGISIKEPFTRE